MTAECDECGSVVSAAWVRVFGVEVETIVEGCLDCTGYGSHGNVR